MQARKLLSIELGNRGWENAESFTRANFRRRPVPGWSRHVRRRWKEIWKYVRVRCTRWQRKGNWKKLDSGLEIRQRESLRLTRHKGQGRCTKIDGNAQRSKAVHQCQGRCTKVQGDARRWRAMHDDRARCTNVEGVAQRSRVTHGSRGRYTKVESDARRSRKVWVRTKQMFRVTAKWLEFRLK